MNLKSSLANKKETIKNTLLVIGVSLAMAVFLGVFDYVFTIVLENVIAI